MIYKKYNLDLYDRFVDEKLLRKVASNDGLLVQYNYTDLCVYKQVWNEVTLFNRGNIYEKGSGRIVARAFPKFFNFEQLDEATQQRYLKEKNYTVFEKIDGCLGILYYYNNEWHLNSRGSFDSFASEAGNRLLEKHRPLNLETDTTYIFEIVSKDTKIILNYDIEELVLLSAYETEVGRELTDNELDYVAKLNNFRRPEKFNYNLDELFELQKSLDYNTEGFVVRLDNGERFKVKSFEYLKIAKIKNNCTKRAIWKRLKNNEVITEEELISLPDELQKQTQNHINELEEEFDICSEEVLEELHNLCLELFNKDISHVSENISEYAKQLGIYIYSDKNKCKHSKIFFNILKGKNCSDYVYDLIEPDME